MHAVERIEHAVLVQAFYHLHVILVVLELRTSRGVQKRKQAHLGITTARMSGSAERRKRAGMGGVHHPAPKGSSVHLGLVGDVIKDGRLQRRV